SYVQPDDLTVVGPDHAKDGLVRPAMFHGTINDLPMAAPIFRMDQQRTLLPVFNARHSAQFTKGFRSGNNVLIRIPRPGRDPAGRHRELKMPICGGTGLLRLTAIGDVDAGADVSGEFAVSPIKRNAVVQ